MSQYPVRVGPATDDERFLEADVIVWFDEPTDLPASEELAGVPAHQRFAADLPDADPGSYPGIYGVRSMQLAVPAFASLLWNRPPSGYVKATALAEVA